MVDRLEVGSLCDFLRYFNDFQLIIFLRTCGGYLFIFCKIRMDSLFFQGIFLTVYHLKLHQRILVFYVCSVRFFSFRNTVFLTVLKLKLAFVKRFFEQWNILLIILKNKILHNFTNRFQRNFKC